MRLFRHTGVDDESIEEEQFHSRASLIILFLMAVMSAQLFWMTPILHVDFYDELWGPSYLLLHGKSPYDTAALDPMQPAGWLPMAIGFYFPLGWLNEKVAMQAWLVFNIVSLCAIVFFAQGKNRTLQNTLVLSLLCFFFPPLWQHLALGQISITVVLCLVLAVHFISKNQDWIVAFLVALALSKPHLAGLPVCVICYYYLKHPGLSLIRFAGKLLLMIVVLCLPLFVAFPGWIPDALNSISNIPFWEHPSLFVFFSKELGAWGYVIWLLLVILIVGFCYFQWKYSSLPTNVYWSLALGLLISPYIGSWDFVALLPLIAFLYSMSDLKRKIILLLAYLAAWRLMALVQAQHGGLNYFFWWIPSWFVMTAALITKWKKPETVRPAMLTV